MSLSGTVESSNVGSSFSRLREAHGNKDFVPFFDGRVPIHELGAIRWERPQVIPRDRPVMGRFEPVLGSANLTRGFSEAISITIPDMGED